MPDQEAALAELAQRNLAERIAANPYPGRGIVAGRLAGGDWLMLYWIMGRSANSRNRRFVVEPNGVLRTAPLRPEELEDPTNVIYRAMCELPAAGRGAGPEALAANPEVFITTNGDHTDTLAEILSTAARCKTRSTSASARTTRRTIPPESPPSWTSAAPPTASRSNYRSPSSAPTKLPRKPPTASSGASPNPPNNTATASTPTPQTAPPPPPFQGDPYLVPLAGTPREIATAYWNHLDQDNRIALAAKQIKPDSQSEIHLAAPNLLP